MNMRQQLPVSVEKIMNKDSRVVTLLGDIGVWSFHNAKKKYPDRVYNIGILEQATIGVAAGLAKTGMIPIVHTIAPFLVERTYEQLMIDFGYQKLGGNFVSVGASYDYSGLGFTHYCPADINILSSIPNMQMIIPGCAEEFDSLFMQAYDNGQPTYYRLCEKSNSEKQKVELGKGNLIKTGTKATVLVVGTMLESVLEAVEGIDVTVLYYTSIFPFDDKLLAENCKTGKLILCEPYYSGALIKAIYEKNMDLECRIYQIGIPKEYITCYGSVDEIDKELGLSADKIHDRIKELL